MKCSVKDSSDPPPPPPEPRFYFAKKKDGLLRLCVDYRGLNKITKKNRYPLPLIGDLVDRLRSAKVYTKIDLHSGYNNVRIAPGHEWKTTFCMRYGLFEYLVMPFGMTNSSATFQYFMNDIFHDMIVTALVLIYLDDIIIFSETLEEHRKTVQRVLQRLCEHDLFLKPEKCEFEQSSVEYLGLIVSHNRVEMDAAKVKAILEWPVPENVKQVQHFREFANFYRRFIDGFSKVTRPLDKLTRKDTPWAWGDEE